MMQMDILPEGRSHFEARLAANKPGEEKMLTQLRQLLVAYGARKHDGDGFFHFPGHGWVCVECKNRLREDGCFWWEKESYHDAQAKLNQCKVLVIVDATAPKACWMTDVRIVGAKARTQAQAGNGGDPAYLVTTHSEDGAGQFLGLGEFVRREASREVPA